MTPERYRRAGEIYHAALALPPDDRSAFLDGACAGDHDLLEDVASLLSAHARAGAFIDAPEANIDALFEAVRPHASAIVGIDDASGSGESLLVAGQQLGRYQVLGLLGAGGMGSVYRALDRTLAREVAIKALARTFRGDSASLRRFEREARMLATLSHPNIATIFGFERLDGFSVPGARARRWRDARGAADAGSDVHRCDRRCSRPDCSGTRRGTRQGCDPPGPQAVERHADTRRPRQAGGLRAGQDRWFHPGARGLRRTHHGSGRRPRHRALHEPRTGARGGRRHAHRRVGVRVRPVRDARRPAGIRGPLGLRSGRGRVARRSRVGCAALRSTRKHPAIAAPVPAPRCSEPPAARR